MRVWHLALALGQGSTIDSYFESDWAEKGIRPAAIADEYEFLRRATLDVLGRLPKPEEIRAFENSPDRSKKIDELLDSPDAAEYFADVWLRILMNDRFQETLPLKMNFPAFRQFLKDVWAKDVPFREFATQLLSDLGDNRKRPASNFLLAGLDPKEPPTELTSKTMRIFLGIHIRCAQCHDHPFDAYTQSDFWSLTAFFNGLKPRPRATFDGFGIKLVHEPKAFLMIPDSSTRVEPRFLGRPPENVDEPLGSLARFVTGHKNFSKVIVNRIWAQLMGRGFVEPVDKFSDARPAQPSELFETLCREFEDSGSRLRPLVRAILRSKAYQLGCEGGDVQAYAAMALKPQTPPQLLNTLSATLQLDVFLNRFYQQYLKAFGSDQDPNNFFVQSYGNREVFRMYLHLYMQGLLAPSGTAPEPSKHAGSVRLALKLMNSKDLQGLVSALWGPLAQILTRAKAPEGRIREIFYTLLSRPPRGDELNRYLRYIAERQGKVQGYEDIYWTLLNATEFFFNH